MQSFCYNGLANLSSIGLISYKTPDRDIFDYCDDLTDESHSSSLQRWESFKLLIADFTSAASYEANNCA